MLEDEGRFVRVIEDAIKVGDLEPLDEWTRSVSDTNARTKMRSNARKEAIEAEAHAKELGVWDELFGDGKKRSRHASKADATQEDQDEEEDEQPVKSKRARSTNSAPAHPKKPSSSKGNTKGKKPPQDDQDGQDGHEDHEDLGGLAALIQKRQESRSGIGGLIARLEQQAESEADARYHARGGKGKRERRDPLGGNGLEPGEPNEDEFLAAQQRLLGKGGSTQGKTNTKAKGKKGH